MWLTDQINTNFISSMFPKAEAFRAHTIITHAENSGLGKKGPSVKHLAYLAISTEYFLVFKSYLTSRVGLVPAHA